MFDAHVIPLDTEGAHKRFDLKKLPHPANANLNIISLLTPAICLALASSLYAQASATTPASTPPPFEQRLRDVRLELHVGPDGLTGNAAPVLEKAIAESRYILIGEDHLTREIPQFATAVCDLMAAQKLSAMAVEAGPQAADFVSGSFDKPDRAARMAALVKKYPDSVAFLNVVQENDLAAHAAKAAHGTGFQLWGLDQEFLGSAGWLLDQMLATRPGKESVAALSRLQKEEQADAAQARQNGDPSKLFLLTATDTELADTSAILRRDENPTANFLLHELIDSREIYLKNAQGSPDSNAQRARLFKDNFKHHLQALTAAGEDGKVLVKLGDFHLYKGINPLHQRDLGNYIAELADGQGTASLHICVLGAKGTHLLYGGYQQPPKKVPFVLDEDQDYRWIKPAIDNQVPGAWTMYDLRPLRFKELGNLAPGMARLIDGYDLLVIVPELTPADLIQ